MRQRRSIDLMSYSKINFLSIIILKKKANPIASAINKTFIGP